LRLASFRLRLHAGGASFDGEQKFDCVTTRLGSLTFPICVYAADKDIWVSASMSVHGGYFESGEVQRFVRLLRADPRLQFVDIGANIGLYTLPIARVTKVSPKRCRCI